MRLIRFKTSAPHEYAISPAAIAWFTDDDFQGERRVAIQLVGGGQMVVALSFDEFAELMEDAMRDELKR